MLLSYNSAVGDYLSGIVIACGAVMFCVVGFGSVLFVGVGVDAGLL